MFDRSAYERPILPHPVRWMNSPYAAPIPEVFRGPADEGSWLVIFSP